MSNSAVKPIPSGFTSLTPHLIIRGAEQAMAFYSAAFGAREVYRMPGPGGKIMHAEMNIGSGAFFLCDEFSDMGACSPESTGGSPVTLHLYVEDVDKVFENAVACGATPTMPIMDMFWGDRYGKLTDPFGHQWSIATQIEHLTPEQILERGAAAMANMQHSSQC